MTADVELPDPAPSTAGEPDAGPGSPNDLAWHEWRRHGIGGSDIGALLGLSSYGSPYTVWADKVGLLPPSPRTERQQVGVDLESAIGLMFTRRTGLYLTGAQMWCVHPEDSWRRCTVDALTVETPEGGVAGSFGPVQMKSDGRFGWPDGPPANYLAQVRWEMGVTGHDRGWLAVLFAGFRFEVFEVAQDADDLAFMIQRAGEFWHEHVVTGIPPWIDGSQATTDALASIWPHDEPGTSAEVDGDTWAEWVRLRERRLELDGVAKAAKKAEDAARNQLVAAAVDAEVLTVDGAQVGTLRTVDGAHVSYDRQPYRVLRAKGEK